MLQEMKRRFHSQINSCASTQCIGAMWLNVSDLGTTYNADHSQANGCIAESGIDYIYTSKILKGRVKLSKSENSS